MTNMQAPQSGVVLKSSHVWFVLYWYFLRVLIQIDDGPKIKRGWGESFIPLAPGRHKVFIATVSITGLGWKPGKATLEVDVPPGQSVQLRYKAPVFMFPGLKGKLSVESPAAMAA